MRPGEWRRQLLSVDSWNYQLMVSKKTLFYSIELCEQLKALKCKTLGTYTAYLAIILLCQCAYAEIDHASLFSWTRGAVSSRSNTC